MKMTKRISLCLFLIIGVHLSGFSQVTIGSNEEPDTNALLDLRSGTGTDSTSTKGLLLPRVTLNATNDASPMTAHVKGMAVYNIATAGTSPYNVTPGYYYNDGDKWVSIAGDVNEPWYSTVTQKEATSNTDSVYVMGKVGIGTATPSAELDIVSSGNTSATKALEINNSSAWEMVTVLNSGQVGIHTDKPITNAALHVSERLDPASSSVDYYNGVMIQRYTTAERDANFTSLSATDNGLTIFNTTTGCYNVWIWSISTASGEWRALCGEKSGMVEFTDCSTINVVGKYDIDNPLTSQTVRIDVPVRVTEMGSYAFSTNTVNGVTFAATGTFVNLGYQTVSLYPVSAVSPVIGTYDYTVTIAPTESAGTSGVSCSGKSVTFVSRASSTLTIVNIAGNQNYTSLISGATPSTNYNSTTSYAQVGTWLQGGSYTGASSAVSYGGVAAINVVNVPYNSMAQLQTALQTASIVWVGASESYTNGYAQLIREWFTAGNGIVMITADKVDESTVADALGYYVEDGATTSGTVVTTNLSSVLSSPFAISNGSPIGYSGSNAGYISSNSGVRFININGNTGAYADILNGAFIFGDKFGSTDGTISTAQRTNFTHILIDIFTWSLKNAPIK